MASDQPSISDLEKVTDQKDLLLYKCNLTMDPNTVSQELALSDGNKKATNGPPHNYPDNPQRFEPGAQVLCKEGLTGRHYWVVEWSNNPDYSDYGAGVAYKGMQRKGHDNRFGGNAVSWFLGKTSTEVSARHNGKIWHIPVPRSGCKKVGVYLDWPAGTLSFYDVTCKTLNHIYTFYTKFTEPVYPGFWVYHKSNYVSLCPVF